MLCTWWVVSCSIYWLLILLVQKPQLISKIEQEQFTVAKRKAAIACSIPSPATPLSLLSIKGKCFMRLLGSTEVSGSWQKWFQRLKPLSTESPVSSFMKCKSGNQWGRSRQSGEANGQECESRESIAKVIRIPTLKVLPGFTKDFQLSILTRDSTN